MASTHEWAEMIFAGNARAVSRAISVIEDGDAVSIPLLKSIFPRTGRARTIGITGAPGTGKSSLVDKLARYYRGQGKKLGIVAVDPTSPFTGGAILGDRIRMPSLGTDDGVFIRSMANRGHLGGLAAATLDVVSVLDASARDVILVETVGVGQDEVEVAELTDITVLLLVPGAGDAVQSFKAGVMEVADIFVVNKSDREGAERVVEEVTSLLELTPSGGPWTPPILRTVATRGDGVDQLGKSIDQFFSVSRETELVQDRLQNRWRKRLLAILGHRLLGRMARQVDNGDLGRYVEEIVSRRQDPYSVVEKMLARAGLNPFTEPTEAG